MNVDIYIRERNGKREIRIPWLPEAIEFESGGTVRATYDIMNKGPVEVHTGSGLCRYMWESIFPGKNRTDKAMMRGSWKDPSTYHNILEDWKAKGTPLCLLVIGYPINKDVILDDYNGKATGGFGDWEYDISFLEDRDITIKSTKVTRPTSTSETYTVRKGDTLWGIAEKFLGSGLKWTTIYNANKEIIESTAKARWKAAGINRDSQNGHWIFEGTVLTIPGAGGSKAPAAPATTAPATTPTTTPTTYKFNVSNEGDPRFYGSFTVYVNGFTKRSGDAKDYSVTCNSGDTVKLAISEAAGGEYNLGGNIKETTFKITKNTRAVITWLGNE